VHAQTAIGVHRTRPSTVVLTALGGDRSPRRFTLEVSAGGWRHGGQAGVGAGVGALHPLTHLPSLPDGRLVVATIRPGEAAAARRRLH
jgi:hypothetical protein